MEWVSLLIVNNYSIFFLCGGVGGGGVTAPFLLQLYSNHLVLSLSNDGSHLESLDALGPG